MILHAFYNLEHIGDCLLIRLNEHRDVTHFEKKEDLCILYHNREVLGYNLFHASQYISHLNDGKLKINEQFVEEFNKVLNQYCMDPVTSDYIDRFYVGKVVDMVDHPDSDHMHICQVDIGSKVLQIVCGASNVAVGQLVVAAIPGAVMPNGLVIKPSHLRGVESHGMLCSARELALKDAPQKRGILVLDEKQYSVGELFFK